VDGLDYVIRGGAVKAKTVWRVDAERNVARGSLRGDSVAASAQLPPMDDTTPMFEAANFGARINSGL
jgi:hypothetical protein